MRVTPNQVIKNMQYIINDRYYDMSRLQENIATGKRLMRPSDNPADVANDLNITTTIAGLAQNKTNIEDSLSFMNVTDTALGGITNALQRMRELSIAASTDTITTTERIYFNKEVEWLFRSIVSMVNTQYKSDYIFGGTETKIPPLDLKTSAGNTVDNYANLDMAYYNAAALPVPAAGVQLFNAFDNSPLTNVLPGTFTLSNGATTYVENVDYTVDYKAGTLTIINPALTVDVTPGTANYTAGQFKISFDYLAKGKDIYGTTVSNQGKISREIEKGVTTRINISADEFLNDPVTGSDMLGSVITLGQDLINNDTSGIGDAIDRLDKVFRAVLAAQGTNGARVNRIESTLDRNASQTIYSEEQQSNLEDVEVASAVTDYMNMQNVYNAALKSAAGVIQQSLVNFL